MSHLGILILLGAVDVLLLAAAFCSIRYRSYKKLPISDSLEEASKLVDLCDRWKFRKTQRGQDSASHSFSSPLLPFEAAEPRNQNRQEWSSSSSTPLRLS